MRDPARVEEMGLRSDRFCIHMLILEMPPASEPTRLNKRDGWDRII